jgi:hypothetical protein
MPLLAIFELYVMAIGIGKGKPEYHGENDWRSPPPNTYTLYCIECTLKQTLMSGDRQW